MRNYFMKSLIALAVLTFVSVPLPVNAQSSDVGLSIVASPTTVARGGTVVVSALVTNNSSSKMRTTVVIMSSSPCGTETSLSYQRISLDAGRTVALTLLYPISVDACQGTYALTIRDSGRSSGKSALATTPSATAYVTVQ